MLSLALCIATLPARAAFSYISYLETTAGQGEAESQLVLGLAYRDGWDGSIKPGMIAFRWVELAAETGDPRPAFVLTLLQREKNRIAKDEARALQCLLAAAEHGDNYARVLLGEMWLEGNGVPADWRRGAAWIRQAALAGFAPGQFRLGLLYLVGDSATPKDDVEALAWFIVAAESGSQSAAELRDQRTALLGRDTAHLAIKRSRVLLGKAAAPASGPEDRGRTTEDGGQKTEGRGQGGSGGGLSSR